MRGPQGHVWTDNSQDEPPLPRQQAPRGLQAAVSRAHTGPWSGYFQPPRLPPLLSDADQILCPAPGSVGSSPCCCLLAPGSTRWLPVSGLTQPFPVAGLGLHILGSQLLPEASARTAPPAARSHNTLHLSCGVIPHHVRSVHNHFSPFSTVTSSRQDLRLSAPCCIASAQRGAHAPFITGQKNSGWGFEPGPSPILQLSTPTSLLVDSPVPLL